MNVVETLVETTTLVYGSQEVVSKQHGQTYKIKVFILYVAYELVNTAHHTHMNTAKMTTTPSSATRITLQVVMTDDYSYAISLNTPYVIFLLPLPPISCILRIFLRFSFLVQGSHEHFFTIELSINQFKRLNVRT